MKKKCVYEVPDMDVLRFWQQDIVVTSSSGDKLDGQWTGTDSSKDNFADLIK